MNDIDFEELDRAVSSTLTPSTDQPTAEAETPALVVPERTAETTNRPVQAPAARRGGRFMDVVHPSSDMRNKNSTPSTPASTSSEPATTPVVAEPESGPEQSATDQSWPDPIDLANQSQESPETPVEDTSDEAPQDSPQESPFLNGAQVEKRPLGGPTPTSSLDDALAQLNMSDEPTTEAAPEPTSIDVPVEPPLVTTPEPAMTPPPLEDTEAEALGEATFAEPESPATPEVVAPEAPATTPVEPTHGNPSIPQQYTEHAPAHDATQSGSIYDTESYHQPLAHPAKKHGSWLIIVWILGLVVLGGGLGAAAYFFLLPLL